MIWYQREERLRKERLWKEERDERGERNIWEYLLNFRLKAVSGLNLGPEKI
jgi:hypothetical protein